MPHVLLPQFFQIQHHHTQFDPLGMVVPYPLSHLKLLKVDLVFLKMEMHLLIHVATAYLVRMRILVNLYVLRKAVLIHLQSGVLLFSLALLLSANLHHQSDEQMALRRQHNELSGQVNRLVNRGDLLVDRVYSTRIQLLSTP